MDPLPLHGSQEVDVNGNHTFTSNWMTHSLLSTLLPDRIITNNVISTPQLSVRTFTMILGRVALLGS